MPKPHRYPAKDGTITWRVRFRHDGRETSETFPTRTEAARFCSDAETRGIDFAIRMRTEEANDTTTPTLDDITEQFMTWTAKRVRSDRTVTDYRRDYRLWIQPALGHHPINRITERDIQAWVDSMLGKLEPKTIGHRHALLYAIFGYAAAPGRAIITANPCGNRAIDLPKQHRKPPKGMTPAEWQALRSCMATIDPDATDLIDFLLGSAWRFSEAIALTTHQCYDDGHTVKVAMTQVARRDSTGASIIVQDGKSDAAMREITVDYDTATMLRRRIARAERGGLVFTHHGGSRWIYGNFRARYWLPAAKAANLSRQPTPHWLRHTHVYWLILQGASLAQIQARVGHESINTTVGTYGRMVADVSPQALEGFARLRGDRPSPIEGGSAAFTE